MKKLFLAVALFGLLQPCAKAQTENVTYIEVGKAQQGVAVDRDHFYVINNTSITKHVKDSGLVTDSIECVSLGLKHMNAAVVVGDQLYCAHSNYPDLPMVSSVEVFDAKNLKHVKTHSFGIDYGSLTWLDFKDGYWWAMFANYSKEGYPVPNTYTNLVQFTPEWQKRQSWILPKALVEKFGNMSCSGGFWYNDSMIYITGHDLPEMYSLKFPAMGSVMIWEKTFAVPVHGQAIAVDRSSVDRTIFGIDRKAHKGIKFNRKD